MGVEMNITQMLDKAQDDLRKTSQFDESHGFKWKCLTWSDKARSFLEELYREVPGLWPLDTTDFENLTENVEEEGYQDLVKLSFVYRKDRLVPSTWWIELHKQQLGDGYIVDHHNFEYAEQFYPATKKELFSLFRRLM